jgi:hypothetical protein
MGTAKQKDRPKAVFSVALIASESGYVERAIPPPIYTQSPQVLIYAAPAGSWSQKTCSMGETRQALPTRHTNAPGCGGPLSTQVCRLIVTLKANCGQSSRTKYTGHVSGDVADGGVGKLAYQIVAVRENETVRCERISVLIAIAKARVWTSEGWQVVIMDETGKALEPVEFDKLLAA